MSTINKKPFIKSLLESMSDEDLNILSSLIDGGGVQAPLLRTLSIKPSGNRSNITNSDKGVHLCNLEANYSLYNGYLIFNDYYCVLIAFTDSQKLTMFEISDTKLDFATIDEELSVIEFRSEIKDMLGGGGGSSEDSPNIYEVESFENVPAEILEQLNVGDIVAQVFNGGAIKKLGFVNQITNHLEILHLDGDIFNFYEYHKVDNEWSLDEHYQQVSQRVYTAYLSDIARLTYDELDVLNLGDVVRTDTETWVVSNFFEEDEDFAIYLCKTTDKSIVFVRYVYNEDDDEYTFDTSYGVDGYATIPLGATQLYSFSLSDNGGEVIGIVTLAKSQLEHLINEFGDHTATIDNFETKFNANQDYDQKDRVVVQLFSDSLSFGITVRSIIAVEGDQGDDEDEAWFYYIESGQITHYAAKMETLKIHHLMPIY